MSTAGLPIVRLLRLSAGSRIVFLTRHLGEPAVARALGPPVPLELDTAVRRTVLEAADPPAGLAPEHLAFLAGCRAHASLGATGGLPTVVAAGVEPLALPGLPRATAGRGHIHVVTRWIDGTPLADAIATLPLAARLELLTDAARLLARIHAGRVAHGSVDLRHVIVDRARVWLVDLRTARRVAPGDPRLAEDVLAFGRLGEHLLAGERPPASSPWPDALRACLAHDPRARPAMSQVLVDLAGAGGDGTVHVADPTAFRAAQPAGVAADPPTEHVPDPVERSAVTSPAALVIVLVAIAAPLAAWLLQIC